jgi:outer membrane lipoprotein-sorting protein
VARLLISRTTALIAGSEKDGETHSFSDYRSIDGELVPFRATIEDSLGTSTIVVDSVRFNVSLDDSVFRPRSAS